MSIKRLFLLAGLGLSVSACTVADIPTRNAPFEQIPADAVQVPEGYEVTRAATPGATQSLAQPTAATPQAASVPAAALPTAPAALIEGRAPVTITAVAVDVPRSLKVSERNSYLPRGDIVWRGDPIGDRHMQVKAIFQDSMARGVQPLNGPVKAQLNITVRRFHALTEKARYTTGGVHSITFDMTLSDPETGELLTPPRTVRADLDGFGGQQALLAESMGQTQKVRISDHLAEVIRQELSNPEGYKNANLGFYQLLNNM